MALHTSGWAELPSFLPSFRPALAGWFEAVPGACSSVSAVRGGAADAVVRAWLAEEMTLRRDFRISFLLRKALVEDFDDAADIVQEAVLKLLEGTVEVPEDKERRDSTFLSTLVNVARDHRKAAGIRRAIPIDDGRASADEIAGGVERAWR